MEKTYVITYEYTLPKYSYLKVFVIDSDNSKDALEGFLQVIEDECKEHALKIKLQHVRILSIVGYSVSKQTSTKIEELNDQAIFEKFTKNINEKLDKWKNCGIIIKQ